MVSNIWCINNVWFRCQHIAVQTTNTPYTVYYTHLLTLKIEFMCVCVLLYAFGLNYYFITYAKCDVNFKMDICLVVYSEKFNLLPYYLVFVAGCWLEWGLIHFHNYYKYMSVHCASSTVPLQIFIRSKLNKFAQFLCGT